MTKLILARLLAVIAVFWGAPAWADTLVENVNGITPDREGRTMRFTGLLIGTDGRIKQVLGRKDKRPKKPDYVVEGQGRTLIPGMIDSHIALMDTGLALLMPGADETGEERQLPPPRPEDLDLALQKAQRLLAAKGITAVADMGTSIEHWQTYRRAGDRGTLYLRIMAYAGDIADMILIGGTGPTPWLYDDRLRLNGILLELDGALGPRQAALKAPYADDPTAQGTLKYGETQLRNMMSRAALDQFQLALAARGDAAVSEALGAIEELAETYNGERRWRIENAQVIDTVDIARFAQYGVVASFQPGRLARERDLATTRLGEARLQAVERWNTLALASVKIVFGSGNQGPPDFPFAGIAAAMTRENDTGQPFGGWQPQERIGREAALAAYTSDAAFAGFAEGRFGNLLEGQRADFLFVDRDPMLAAPSELRKLRVLETWIGGAKVYEAPALDPPAGMTGR